MKMTSSSRKRSPLWRYFELSSDHPKYAFCLLCHVTISRGGEGKKAGTSAMNNHIRTKHPDAFSTLNSTPTAVPLSIPWSSSSSIRENEPGGNQYYPPDAEDEKTNIPDLIGPSGVNADSQDEVESTGDVENLMYEAYSLLKQVVNKPKDESDMFCDLLSLKLKALDDDTRERAMHEISNLMFHLKKSTK